MPTPKTPAPNLEEGFYFVPDELRDAYHLSLGRFIDAFGRTETGLAVALDRFVTNWLGDGGNQAHAISRAILGSQRTKEMSETIKRILRVTNADKEDQVLAADALRQLAEIQHVRDRIAHQSAGMEFFNGAWHVRNSNHNQVKEESQIEQLRLTIEDMDNMTEDLWQIQGTIRFILLPSLRSMDNKGSTDALPTWHHKPSALKRQRHSI